MTILQEGLVSRLVQIQMLRKETVPLRAVSGVETFTSDGLRLKKEQVLTIVKTITIRHMWLRAGTLHHQQLQIIRTVLLLNRTRGTIQPAGFR